MKYGTICSKHDNIIANTGSADKILDNIRSLLSDVESYEQFKAYIKSDIIYAVKEVENLLYDIKSNAEKCLEDGQRMEDGLVKKQTTINNLCDEVEGLEQKVDELQSQIDSWEAEDYNRQIGGE
jgi:uncharacterized protein Yka (UPF0111/DUF47 family)